MTVLRLERADRGLHADRLVTLEVGDEPGAAGERRGALAQAGVGGPGASRAGLTALLIHQLLEARFIDAETLIGHQLEREIDREAVRVVQPERVLGRDAFVSAVLRALDQFVEQL